LKQAFRLDVLLKVFNFLVSKSNMMQSEVFSQFDDDILSEELEIAKDMIEQLKKTNQVYIVGHDVPISVSKVVFERVDTMRKVYAAKHGIPQEQFEFEDILSIWSGLVPERAFFGQDYIPPVSKRVEWTDEEGEVTGATVDAMCADFIQQVNAAGHKTLQSCSGAMQDHPGARCGWDMAEGYVSFIVDESFGDYGEFPSDKIAPYAIDLYNAINDAGWCASLGTTLFVPTVTARPTCLGKNAAYILYGKEFHGHDAYEYLIKNHPEALEHPTNSYHREAIAAGPYTKAQKDILKKWSAFDKFKCEVVTNDQVMKRKWDDLLQEILKVKPREWT
jgi:hypothetical protein